MKRNGFDNRYTAHNTPCPSKLLLHEENDEVDQLAKNLKLRAIKNNLVI